MADRSKTWRLGEIVTIGFLDGDPTLHERIFKIASEWTRYANITLAIEPREVLAKIRVSVKSGGSWSYIGTDSLRARYGKPTMQLGWVAQKGITDDDFNQVVLHEFGHSLGLLHEHQNPKGGIPWDWDRVIEYYRNTQGWDAETTRINVMANAATNDTKITDFDPDSIMLYPIPESLTTNGYSTGWNTKLSAGDIAMISSLYPQGHSKWR